MFRGLKDKALSKSLEVAINLKIKEYGEMLKLNLDSQNKTIEFEVMLKGEKEPLKVFVNNYEIYNAPICQDNNLEKLVIIY